VSVSPLPAFRLPSICSSRAKPTLSAVERRFSSGIAALVAAVYSEFGTTIGP
jgi:hypothetical protein